MAGLLSMAALLQAAPGIPFIHNFTPPVFGTNAQNLAIVQDQRGLIYVGNEGGVLEYDGVHWRLIPTRNRTCVCSLALDTQGRVYVGAQGEIGYLTPDTSGRMVFVSMNDLIDARDRAFGDVWFTLATSRGIFFSSANRLFRYAHGRIRAWQPAKAFRLSALVGERLLIREEDRGLMELEGDTLRLLPGGERFARERMPFVLPLDGNLRTSVGPGIGGLPSYPAGQQPMFLVGTERRMFSFDGCGFTAFHSELDDLPRELQIYRGLRLQDGTLAISVLQKGIVLMDQRGKIQRILDKHSGLQDETVYALAQDRQGGLWAGEENGISRVEMPSPFVRFDERSGLEGVIYALTRHNGCLYVGTHTGLYRETLSGPAGGKPQPAFRPIPGVKGQTWNFLSYGQGLLVANWTGLYEVMDDRATLLRPSSMNTLCLCTDACDPSRIWVGLQDGLTSLLKTGEGWIDEGKVQRISDLIRSITAEKDGSLWLETSTQGLIRLRLSGKGASRDFSHRFERFGMADGLPSLKGNFVFKVQGETRFASRDGIFRFDEATKRFVADSRFATLFAGGSRWVTAAKEDPEGQIWMSLVDERQGGSDSGLALPQPDGSYRWERTPFLRFKGMGFDVFHLEAEGVAWFSISNGLFRYDPKVPKNYRQGFQALVRSVSTRAGRILFGGTEGSRASAESGISLRFSENALRFEFAAPFYEQESATRYQVRLDGHDRDWGDWSLETVKEYTNLAPGAYRFRVRAMNIYEIISEEAAFKFRIQRPWWMTWWARMLAIICLSLPMTELVWWFVFRMRLRRLHTINAVLNERARLAQEIHDGLGHGLTSITYLLRKAKVEFADNAAATYFERATSLAESALRAARDTAYAIRRPAALQGGLQEALARLGKIEAGKGRIETGFEGNPRPLPEGLELHVFRIAEEALTNALRHAQADVIEIRSIWRPGTLRLDIKDDGHGFDLSRLSVDDSGMGLQGMRDRIASLGGRLLITSEPGQGCRVTVLVAIPIGIRMREFGARVCRRVIGICRSSQDR